MIAPFFAVLAVITAAHPFDTSPTVDLGCGDVIGVWASSEGTAGFLGIPYAMPPLPPRRFRPPVAGSCFTGLAVKQPNACLQFSPIFADLPQSEDCLYLNVYSRLPTQESLPVLFWIYGGDNTFGSTTTYGSVQNIVDASDGKIVLVVINYRVGVTGYLALRELSQTDPRGTSGNYGIADAQMALQWVQTNIHKFGGDKSRVTIIGQSSGGTNVLALLASAKNKGLFSAAISLSGSPNITMGLATAENQGLTFVANANCSHSSDVLACLNALSSADIVAAFPPSWDYGGSLPQAPDQPYTKLYAGLVIADGYTVEKPLLTALAEGVVDVPVIFQNMMCELDFMPVAAVANWTASEFVINMTQHFDQWGSGVGATITEPYKAIASQHGGAYAFYAMGADIGVFCGDQKLAFAAVKGFRSSVYLSTVTQGPQHPLMFIPPLPVLYPSHLWDFMAGFNAFDMAPAGPYHPGPADLALGDVLRSMWLNLAYHGDLNSSTWKRFHDAPGFPAHYQGLTVSTAGTSVVDWHKAMCAAWEQEGFGQQWWWIN